MFSTLEWSSDGIVVRSLKAGQWTGQLYPGIPGILYPHRNYLQPALPIILRKDALGMDQVNYK